MRSLFSGEVVGVNSYEFDKDGRHYHGSVLYVTFDETGTEGIACGRVTAPSRAGSFRCGDAVTLLRGEGGRLDLAVMDHG